MEGNAAGTIGAGTEVERADGSPHDSQPFRARRERSGAGELRQTLHTGPIEATAEIVAETSDPSDPRLVETEVTSPDP